MNRATCGIIDEFRDHNADDISSIILPLLNVDRPMMNQDVNKNEPQQVQLWISSASDKNTYCYDKTIELLEMTIINPKESFVWGFDFGVPVAAGLLSRNYLNEMKLDSTFTESGFAKEYMSRFIGTSDEAWFDYEKIASRRLLVNPETHEKTGNGTEFYYILSVDVARLGCQTVCTVLKVFPNADNYHCNLVNLYVLGKTEEEKIFDKQVVELKKLIRDFNPKEVVIDINGIGAPFADTMIKENYDPLTGETFPAYGFFNREELERIQPRSAPKILYGIKANAQINSDMHSTLYSWVYSGRIKFLISELDAKTKLMATIRGQKLPIEKRYERLLPHDLTSILIQEILNLRVKPTGVSNQIAVELINKRMTKDKFSALEMGVYRVSLIEQEYLSHRRNRGLNRKLTFFTKKGR